MTSTDITAIALGGLPLVHPIHEGVVVDPRDLEGVCGFIDELRELRRTLTSAISAAEAALISERERLGLAQTIRVGKYTATISKPADIQWDLEILRELGPAGLPEERWHELVTVEYVERVSASVAKQIAGANDRYREIIQRAQTRVEKPPRVSVK